MASVSFKKGDREFSFFTNFWAFAQAYWKPDKSEAYHNELLAGCDKLWRAFCADKNGKPLEDVSSKRMDALIKAFALSEEHSFLNDFIRYTDKFSHASSADEWERFVDEAKDLIGVYCYDDSWPCRKRKSMILDFLVTVDNELQRRRKEGK